MISSITLVMCATDEVRPPRDRDAQAAIAVRKGGTFQENGLVLEPLDAAGETDYFTATR
jgi:hypothetical protein